MYWVICYTKNDSILYLTPDRDFASLSEAKKFKTKRSAYCEGEISVTTGVMVDNGYTWSVEKIKNLK